MLSLFLSKIAPAVAALRILVATLPGGDVERALFAETDGGVAVLVERRSPRSDDVARRRLFVPAAAYSWQIVEERRSVLMALPGRPTGVVQRVYGLRLFVDRRDRSSVTPNPIESFRFYAPTREAAEALRERLKAALKPKKTNL